MIVNTHQSKPAGALLCAMQQWENIDRCKDTSTHAILIHNISAQLARRAALDRGLTPPGELDF